MSPTEQPWFVRVLVGIGAWVGAALVALFLVAGGPMRDLFQTDPGRCIGAVLFLGLAVFLLHRNRGDLAGHLGLAASLAGHALVLWQMEEMDLGRRAVPLTLLLLQLGALIVFDQALHRFLSAGTFGIALYMLARLSPGPLWGALALVGLAGLVTAWWLLRERLENELPPRIWPPVAHGLAVGLLALLIFDPLEGRGALMEHPVLLGTTVGFALLAGLIAWRAAREVGAEPDARGLWLALAGIGAVGALTLGEPWVMGSLLVLVLGRLRRSPVLEALAWGSLAFGLTVLYYRLDTTLMMKSLYILATGVVLLALRWLTTRLVPGDRPASALSAWSLRPGRATLLAACTILALMVAVGWVVRIEGHLRSGETIFLELGPRDPRALLKGDYMRLRYALAREAIELENLPRRGRLILQLDERGVAATARVDDGTPLGPEERPLRFRRHEFGRLHLAPDEFFFPEGQGKRYQAARYGELKLDGRGRVLLVGLRDEELGEL